MMKKELKTINEVSPEKFAVQTQFCACVITMVVQVLEFSSGGTKLERFLHKNQHNQRKLLNFEFWINGEVSKIGHHFY